MIYIDSVLIFFFNFVYSLSDELLPWYVQLLRYNTISESLDIDYLAVTLPTVTVSQVRA